MQSLRELKEEIRRSPYRSKGKESVVLRQLIHQYDIHPVVVDIGARLGGSNSYDLIKNLGFKGILSEKQGKHLEAIRNELPECDLHGTATPQNVNSMVPEKVGVLSIDVDGNDYHLWGAIKARPQIVIIEMGAPHKLERWGKPQDWVPPYDPANPKRFDGASKQALVELGERKGYWLYKTLNVNLVFLHETLHPAGEAEALTRQYGG